MTTPTMSKLDRYKVAARMWWALVVKPKVNEVRTKIAEERDRWMSLR